MKTLALLGAAALAFAVSASPAAAQDFTGPRVEIHAGWDRVGIDDTGFRLDQREDDATYGVGIGYDVALGERLIAGVEASFDLSETKFEEVAGNTRVEAEAKRDIEVAARLGTRVGDNLLLYGKAGYTNARFEGATIVGGTTGSTRTPFSENLDGLRVGAGAEVALARNAYAKAEYRYSNYESGVTRNQVIAGLGFRF